MNIFRGTGVALVTPFHKDLSVDVEGLERIVNHAIEGGVNYLVVLGTTAETATLTKAEQELVKETVIAVNAGRLPLVLGVGGNNTIAVVEELKQLNTNGWDAILSVSPFYNKPTQEGIYQHFKAIAAATPLPILLYNVPGRTGSNMQPDTVVRLAKEFPEFIGIKEACGDMVQVYDLLHKKPKDFLVISGDDVTALATTLAGGDGVISVLGQGIPVPFCEMIQLGLQGKSKDAYLLHYQMLSAMHAIFEQGNPAGIKAMFNTLHLANGTVRLPLVAANTELQHKIADAIASFLEAKQLA